MEGNENVGLRVRARREVRGRAGVLGEWLWRAVGYSDGVDARVVGDSGLEVEGGRWA